VIDVSEHSFEATQRSGVVSALLTRPAGADCLLVLERSLEGSRRSTALSTRDPG